MKTVCGRNESGVRAAAANLGWEGFATDWREVIADPEIDIVDVSTPGASHCEIVCAAAEAGKVVFCEKPIGNTLAEAEKMAEAVRKSGRPSAVFHNYRKAPAVALAKQWIEEGRLGRIFHIRSAYLQDWIANPEFPLVWRLQKDQAGSGALADIGSHIVDMARHLVGEFTEVCGTMETFVKRRPLVGSTDGKLGARAASETGEVTVDDATVWIARLGDVLGTFEATRFAVGRKNLNRFEINAEKGSLAFNLERMNELEWYDASAPEGAQGFSTIQATEAVHPYAGHYWPVGHIIGYEHTFLNLVADAVTAVATGARCVPDMEDGLANQRVLDAVERSAASRSWVSL